MRLHDGSDVHRPPLPRSQRLRAVRRRRSIGDRNQHRRCDARVRVAAAISVDALRAASAPRIARIVSSVGRIGSGELHESHGPLRDVERRVRERVDPDHLGPGVVVQQRHRRPPGARRMHRRSRHEVSRGWIDEVIRPHNTRRRIAGALRMLRGKQVPQVWKKHDNIPL